MSIEESETYWSKIHRGKKLKRFKGPNYYHVPGFDCGHHHWYEAEHIGQVNCKGCLDLIYKGNAHNLKPIPGPHIKAPKMNYKDAGKTIIPCPKCSGQLVERTNSQNGTKFLGCNNYPCCEYTRRIYDVEQLTRIELLTKDICTNNTLGPIIHDNLEEL